jgi:hypothetical protein
MTNGLLHQSDGALISAPIKITQQATASSRLLYIDNIRSFLTILVLLHHIMITYASSGSWIYTENRQDLATEVVGSIFCTVNQAFFMGLFLFISAYFVPGAYDRKGPARFWKDRLIRLGIPLAMYSWLANLPDSVGRFWLRVSGIVLLMYIPGALLGGALVSDLPFRGGWTWQRW